VTNKDTRPASDSARGALAGAVPDETAAARLARWRRNYRDELDSAALYRILARHEPDSTLAGVYERIAATEDRHRGLWAQKLAAAGEDPAAIGTSGRVRLLGALAGRFGGRFALPLVRAMEIGADRGYAGQPRRRRSGWTPTSARTPVSSPHSARRDGATPRSSRASRAVTRPAEATPCAQRCSEPTTAWSRT
jgi:hypothetical protein